MRGFPDRTSRSIVDGIRADLLVKECGAKKLIGRRVVTPALGSYPGGLVTIIEVGHDDSAPEIVFLVQHDTWRDPDISDDGTMGIFDYELVKLK